MTRFRVYTNGVGGLYEAANENAAIAAYCRDLGYQSMGEVAKALGQTVEEFLSDVSVTLAGPVFTFQEVNDDENGYFIDYSANYGRGREVTPSTSWLMAFHGWPIAFHG